MRRTYSPIKGAAVDTLLFNGGVRLIGVGKYFPDQNGVKKKQDWSLRLFANGRCPDDADNSVINYLPDIGRELETKFFYAPSPADFNAKIATENDIKKREIKVTSPIYKNTVWLFRGEHADGMLPWPGTVYAVSVGGCPVVILRDKRSTLTGTIHAGMRTLIDEGRLKQELGIKGASPRKHESGIMALIEAMYAAGLRHASDLEAVIAFPIKPQHFTYSWFNKDPEYRRLNLARSLDFVESWGLSVVPGFGVANLQHHGQIDLDALIRAQLVFMGVTESQIQTLDAPHDWYTTRGDKLDRLKRNLVIVQNL